MQNVRVMSVFEADNTKITHNLTRTDLEILKQLIENPRKRIEQLSKETKKKEEIMIVSSLVKLCIEILTQVVK